MAIPEKKREKLEKSEEPKEIDPDTFLFEDDDDEDDDTSDLPPERESSSDEDDDDW